ncbi:MAG: hypothetical protein ACYDCH_09155 [Gaiellaceae bacterium]
MDLERELSALRVAWPETPAFRLELAPRRDRRARAVAAAVVAAALAAALAVPQSRGALLRFLHLGSVEIRFVDTLPPAQERALGADLGPLVTPAAARRELGRGPLLLPPLRPTPPLHDASGVISFVFAYEGRQVLVSETGFGGDVALKKAVGGATTVVPAAVGSATGLFLAGAPHVYIFPGAPARLAGNVLIWATRYATYRIEGRGLTRTGALALAVRMR